MRDINPQLRVIKSEFQDITQVRIAGYKRAILTFSLNCVYIMQFWEKNKNWELISWVYISQFWLFSQNGELNQNCKILTRFSHLCLTIVTKKFSIANLYHAILRKKSELQDVKKSELWEKVAITFFLLWRKLFFKCFWKVFYACQCYIYLIKNTVKKCISLK